MTDVIYAQMKGRLGDPRGGTTSSSSEQARAAQIVFNRAEPVARQDHVQLTVHRATPEVLPQAMLAAAPRGAGGGYGGLANHEGPVVGKWLANQGITAFVLRYRLAPKYHHPTQLTDVQRAIRFVRSHSPEWKLKPQAIGILGFSAGGHLASLLAKVIQEGALLSSLEAYNERWTASWQALRNAPLLPAEGGEWLASKASQLTGCLPK